ncbi:hypothetical protein TIFTF001_027282 [Ficus carica]|uniref:Uncharacterized protein n=1 Tax=Ficus carica TaxID=3494 RepID=A0AA88DMQ9_FICCA|nr:hypothetical protein TIFTF001_027282 [Ficus carica]
MSTDFSDSSSDDDELTSTIHRSRFEHEFEHNRRDAGTSSKASERNRPTTTSGAKVLSIPPIARLTKPPRREAGVELSVDDILAIYYPQENSKDHGRYSMYPRRKKQSMGGLANAFYPLWGSLRKELKKPPSKAFLFEEKLERLLTLLNREWDEINVDWPFVIRGALRRLFGTPLFIEPLTDDEALIAEFALDTMNMEFPNPKDLLAKRKASKEVVKAAAAASENVVKGNKPAPFPIIVSSPEPPAKPVSPLAKKRKAVEKAKRKVPAKRNKKSKVATPEPDIEPRADHQGDQQVEVELPPRLSLLEDRKAGVELVRQLLSEADANIMYEGRLQNHLDDLLWDGLKVNIRAMGLFYRTTDRVVAQKARIKELEDKDMERGEKLLNIERKFEDV